ncbi:MAG: hypothetical protein U1F77_03565 [Kiritimatiellia bacterium]
MYNQLNDPAVVAHWSKADVILFDTRGLPRNDPQDAVPACGNAELLRGFIVETMIPYHLPDGPAGAFDAGGLRVRGEGGRFRLALARPVPSGRIPRNAHIQGPHRRMPGFLASDVRSGRRFASGKA